MEHEDPGFIQALYKNKVVEKTKRTWQPKIVWYQMELTINLSCVA